MMDAAPAVGVPVYDAVPGAKVYLDSFAGLVPAIVEEAHVFEHGIKFRARVTAERDGYERGRRVEWSQHYVVPRGRVRWRRWSTIILPYRWQLPMLKGSAAE